MARVKELKVINEIDSILQSDKTNEEVVLLISHVIMRYKEEVAKSGR